LTHITPGQVAIIRFECADGVICMDRDTPQLSKFTLRDEGKTIGFGKIVLIKE
jgi:peptide chain release factor subunit 3